MISLYTPKIEELSFRQALLADPATMHIMPDGAAALTFRRKNGLIGMIDGL